MAVMAGSLKGVGPIPDQATIARFDVVDTQLHVKTGMIDATIEAMDAIGVRSVLIDEFWASRGGPHPAHFEPGYLLSNGSWRAAWPTAEQASLRHPDRFSYLVRIDPRDPDLEVVMRFVASSPNARAFRLQPVWTVDDVEHFAEGGYDHLFDIAGDLGLPLFIFIPGHVELLARYARRFPEVTCIVDHCGMGFRGIPAGRPAAEAASTRDPAYFEEVLRLAEFPNVLLKWAHAQDAFGASAYPYESLRPTLRRAIEAFGADRLMWASDKSVMVGHTWGDLLRCVSDDPALSLDEKQWILGETARSVLRWPTTEANDDARQEDRSR